jgi:hypothetical protein
LIFFGKTKIAGPRVIIGYIPARLLPLPSKSSGLRVIPCNIKVVAIRFFHYTTGPRAFSCRVFVKAAVVSGKRSARDKLELYSVAQFEVLHCGSLVDSPGKKEYDNEPEDHFIDHLFFLLLTFTFNPPICISGLV